MRPARVATASSQAREPRCMHGSIAGPGTNACSARRTGGPGGTLPFAGGGLHPPRAECSLAASPAPGARGSRKRGSDRDDRVGVRRAQGQRASRTRSDARDTSCDSATQTARSLGPSPRSRSSSPPSCGRMSRIWSRRPTRHDERRGHMRASNACAPSAPARAIARIASHIGRNEVAFFHSSESPPLGHDLGTLTRRRGHFACSTGGCHA